MSARENPGSFRNPMRVHGPATPGRIEKAGKPAETLKRLAGYFAPYRRQLISVTVLIIVYTLLGLAGPYLMGVAIDRSIASKDIAGLSTLALLMLAAYAFCNIFQVLAGWIMAKVSQTALQELGNNLFAHIQELPVGYFDRNPAGSLMSRLTNDIDAVNQAVSQNVTSLLASALSLGGIIVAMFLLDRWLALTSLLVIPLMIWFTQFVARYTRKGFRELQRDLGEMNGFTEESVSGLKVIRAFRRNHDVIDTFREQNSKVFRSSVQANSYALLLMPLTNVLGNLFVIVIAGFGGWLALHGLVTVGIIASFIIYGQNFIQPLRQLANMYNTIQAALAGSERIFEILDIPPEIDNGTGSLEMKLDGLVEFEHVSFGYDPQHPVVTDMSFRAEPGQTIALVGPTGAGKTTIINLLTRFYELGQGKVTIDGKDIREITKASLRSGIGLVLQDTFLFSGSVLDNIRFGRLDATDEECMKAAELAEADRFIRQLPQGYSTVLSERAGNLSQGQRQLLSIARVILSDPEILILDEATSSVDTRTELRIQKALLRLMEGRTSFVIAHRLSTIREADEVLVISGGTIVERGTHQELLERQGIYHHLYMSQFKGLAI